MLEDLSTSAGGETKSKYIALLQMKPFMVAIHSRWGSEKIKIGKFSVS